jgi:hypothetical protein
VKNLKTATLLALAFAGLLLVLPSTASAQLPSGTFDIAFTRFCDGMHLTRTGPVSLAGTLTGCVSGIAGGPIAFNYQINPFTTTPWVGGVVDSTINAPCIVFYELNFTTQRWANYQTCSGEPLSKINSGSFTFSVVAAAELTGAKPSGKQ